MDNSLLKRYREYARTEEAFAVLFVKQHLSQSRGHWVDISNCRQYEMSSDRLHFRFVTGGLYKRKIHPQYPPKSSYTTNGKFDKDGYYLMVRAITWEAAHKDIRSPNLPLIRFARRGTHRGAGIQPIQMPDRFMQANNIFKICVAKMVGTIDFYALRYPKKSNNLNFGNVDV